MRFCQKRLQSTRLRVCLAALLGFVLLILQGLPAAAKPATTPIFSLRIAPKQAIFVPENDSFAFDIRFTAKTISELKNVKLRFIAEPLNVDGDTQPLQLGAVTVAVPEKGDTTKATFTVSSSKLVSGFAAQLEPVTVFRVTASAPKLPKVTASTVFVFNRHADTPVSDVTAVIPLTFPQTVRTVPSIEELGSFFAADAPLPRLLAAAVRLNATVLVDPRLLLAIRVYGDAAPAGATEFLQTLETASLPVYLLQYADADPVLQQQLLAAGSLPLPGVRFVDAAKARLGVEQLTGLPQARGKIAWFNPGFADQTAVDTAFRLGAAQILVNSSDFVDPPQATRVLVSAKTQLLVADTALVRATTVLATADTASFAYAEAAAQLYAGLAASPQQLLVFSRGFSSANEQTLKLLEQLETTGFLRFVSEDAQPVADAAQLVSTRPHNAGFEKRLAALEKVLQREKVVTRNSALLADPHALQDYQRARILQLLGAFHTYDVAQFGDTPEAILRDFHALDADIIEAVKLLTPAQTHIFGSSAKLPLQVHNALPFNITVRITVEPTSAALRVEKPVSPPLRILPGQTVTTLVPLHSRVSSGDSGLIVYLTDVSGKHTVTTATFPLALSSRVETVGVVVLAVGAALLFGFGLLRSFRKRK